MTLNVPSEANPALTSSELADLSKPWQVRVWWHAVDKATCPEFTVFGVDSEDQALDEAVSVMDGCRHRRALVIAVRAEIRPAGTANRWRTIGAGHVRSYL